MLQCFKSPSVTRLSPALSTRTVAAPRSTAGRVWKRGLTLGALALGLLTAPALAETQASTQLSEGLPFSDVSFTTTRPQISPDGQFAVYRQDAVTDGGFDLWSVRMDGSSAPERLSDPLPATQGQFLTFEISPDSSRVVYAVDQDTTGKTELYSVPIDGGPVTRISTNMGADRDVIGFKISPTSDRVFYYSDDFDWTEYDLYSVPIDGPGSASVQLNDPLPGEHDVDGFQVSPDGETVIYRQGRNTTGLWRLWSVPAAGGEPFIISGDGAKIYFQITPDSSRVLLLDDATFPGSFDLFSVKLDGTELMKISTGIAANYSIEPSFLISPGGSRVVFRGATPTAQKFELFSVPVAGGTVVRLNGTLATTEDVEPGFSISPNGSKVVYRSDEDVDDVIDLWSVPLAGGTAPTRLNSPLAGASDVLGASLSPPTQDPAISADSSRVVYMADAVDTLNELWSVPIGGGLVSKLNRTLTVGGDVQAFKISPNSAWVVYGADQDIDTLDELLAVQITGGAVQDLNGPLTSGGDVSLRFVGTVLFDISPNGLDVLYCADETTNDQIELYTASIAGTPNPPTSVVAAAGNAQATVSFAPPTSTGGSPILGYTVTSNPPGGTDSNAGSTGLAHVVTGLVNGTSYTFTVTATNSFGTSAPSAPSASVTPATVPGAPTGAVAIPRNHSADVAFTAPASDGGNAITGYTVVSNPPGGIDLEQGTLSLNHLVSGLTNGIGYTFTVVAVNAVGASLASGPSASVVPGCETEVPANVFCDGVESSDTANWNLTANPPGAPTGVAATAGISTVIVTFVAPTDSGGSAITGYTVTSLPAGGVDSDAGSLALSHVITGLTSGTPYTFTVTAANSSGTGPASAPSNSVALPTVPTAPLAPVAVGGDASATVTFVAPLSDGGSPITGYTVTSDPAGGIDDDAGTTGLVHNISGLVNGTPYTFTVTATNLVGASAASKASNEVTPSTN